MERATAIVLCVWLFIQFSACFDLTILHTNDVHAHFQEFNKYGSDCSEKDANSGNCFGGVARRKTKIDEIRSSHGNVMLLDAGDQWQGTLWFTVFKGAATSHFMNRLGYDVMSFGNHEFDTDTSGLASFLDNVTFPVVGANVDVTNEPRLKGKFVNTAVLSFEKDTEKVGVIGYLTENTPILANPVDTISFTDIMDAVKREVANLQNSGIDKIIALGHAGYSIDKKVAEIPGVDVVVGGHTDTFLFSGAQPSNEIPKGPYPTVISQPGNKMALVVQDFTWGKYLGYLNVTFDDSGNVIAYSGNPILLDNSVSQDTVELEEVNKWYEEVVDLKTMPAGHTNVLLDGFRDHCRLQECNLGNLIADAILEHHLDYPRSNESWGVSSIALLNSGGIRASINKGQIAMGDIITVQPFRNLIDMVRVTGQNLLDQLEISVAHYNTEAPRGGFLQVSGIKVVYNLNRPPGKRVVSVQVRCLECDVPDYFPLDKTMEYNVLVNTFVIGGGDSFKFEPLKHTLFNTMDSDVTAAYIKKHTPVFPSVEGRIVFDTSSPDDDTTCGSCPLTTATSLFPRVIIAAMCSILVL